MIAVIVKIVVKMDDWRCRVVALALGMSIALGGWSALAPPVIAGEKPVIGYQQAFTTTGSATPEAQIEPRGSETTCAVEYISEGEFQTAGWTDAKTQACAAALGAGSNAVTGFARIEGLAISSSYRYRFVATNEAASTTGPEGTFVTFGIKLFTFEALDEGNPVTQAGAHPSEQVTHIVFKTNPGRIAEGAGFHEVSQMATLKDVKVELPVGLTGSPAAVPQCAKLASEEFKCPPEAQIGTIEIVSGENESLGVKPLFNLVPPTGVAARFSARFSNFANAFIDARVRTGEDYGVDADSLDITSLAPVKEVTVRLWGVPAEAGHDGERACVVEGGEYGTGCESKVEVVKPFLTMPTSCLGPTDATLAVDAYQQPPDVPPVEATVHMPAITGCSSVQFSPGLSAQPTTATADSPTGLNVELSVLQNESPEGRASADLRKAVVTLPKGMTVNPASASGMVGCSPAQLGLTTPVGTTPIHTTAGPAECPGASEIGTVEVDTPLLSYPLTGSVYLATPYENPFGSLLAIYIAVHDPISGVVVKLAGHVELGEEGQLTTTFEENPQLPFSAFKLKFNEGQRASLKTPATCGSYQATSMLEPWSHEAPGEVGTPDASPASPSFQITASPAGGACATTAAAEPNAPKLEAGSTSTKAGSYSPFVTRVTREDGSQQLLSLTITAPPGLVGSVTGIPYCPESDIAAAAARSGAAEQADPSCPANTEVGTVTVGSGAGSDPLYVGGRVYFAGPWEGAPFSFVVVTPALAGPFDLGTVVVRAGIYINPNTAQVSVKSATIPQELKGIPLDIKSVAISLSRSNFTLNPTSCAPMAVTGNVVSTLGQSASMSDRFQVGGCEKLAFKPTFKVTTSAQHTRRFGAYLRVGVTSGGGQANISSVFVELPKILVARDETLNKACSETQFAANPAACPAGSFVGSAIAYTPVLPVPLSGSVIFVSHGGAKFPDLDAVLQGDGVTVVLKGATEINEKTEITSSNFNAVPDVPISSFQMTLPTGPYSALSATGNLCTEIVTKRVKVKRHGKTIWVKRHVKRKRELKMPTKITGHNGAVIKSTTIIAVEHCAKLKSS